MSSKEYRAASAQMKRVKKSKEAVTRQELTPVLRVKLRPRGKSFEKGNGFGSEHRFKKGEPSRNPGGRPKSKEISKALRKKLASEVSLPRKGRTYAEKLADKWIDLGMAGNAAAISAISDRVEGRPFQSVTIDQREDPFTKLFEGVDRLAAALGPPDDESGPLLLEENNGDHDANG